MSQSLATATAAYALALAGVAAFRAALARPPGELLGAAAVVLGAALALQAVLCVVELVGGPTPPDTGTAVGYLVASVAILPAAAPLASEPSGWSSAILALAFIALAVVALRLAAVWA